MKFQKTLLAASLAVAALSTANAAVVKQDANPVVVTENLVNDKYVNSDWLLQHWTALPNGNQVIVGSQGVSQAPVHSELATTYNNNVQGGNRVTADYLPVVSDIMHGGNKVGIDLGTQAIDGTVDPKGYTYDVFKYTNKNGQTVYRLQEIKSQQYVPGTFTQSVNSNGEAVLTANQSISAQELENQSIWALERGGQLTGSNFTNTTGYETKLVNGEHVIYGYQGQSGDISGNASGNIVTPSANNQYVTADFSNVQSEIRNDIRYVQSGIIANTGDYLNGLNGDQYLDPSKNIYGVSARDNNNVVMMTGNGIALADLSVNNGKGTLQTDGSVLVRSTSGETSVSQKSRSYEFGGKTLVEVYNDVPGAEFTTQWYEVVNGDKLEAYAGETPAVGSHDKTGTANFTTGTVNNAVVHNTVTNKNVTYKESVVTTKEDRLDASVTTSTDVTTDKYEKQNSVELVSETSQYVSTGVIEKDDKGGNVYGTEVGKTVTKDGKTTTAKTTITADYVDSGDFRINGVSIVDNIKDSVDSAVEGASEAIDAKVAEVDQKIVEVDSRLTQFNGVAAGLNNRVDQLNARVDDVEKTAYRGTAIALAAQQNVPNIGAGQTAVFGGVGHYESESAFALGLATVLKDGRTSISGALGVAGGSEVGGRLGVAYVFGGK